MFINHIKNHNQKTDKELQIVEVQFLLIRTIKIFATLTLVTKGEISFYKNF